LEREVPPDHPVAVKVEGALRKLVERYGGSPGPQVEAAPKAGGVPSDEEPAPTDEPSPRDQ
jgi:hypothetical protein